MKKCKVGLLGVGRGGMLWNYSGILKPQDLQNFTGAS
jgi:hypothetical protein